MGAATMARTVLVALALLSSLACLSAVQGLNPVGDVPAEAARGGSETTPEPLEKTLQSGEELGSGSPKLDDWEEIQDPFASGPHDAGLKEPALPVGKAAAGGER